VRDARAEGRVSARNVWRYVLVGMTLSLAPMTVQAQSNGVSPAMDRAVQRARGLVESGESAGAHTLLDSLVDKSPSASVDLAEALFWRAVLAERIGDAERDWKRLVIEVPLSPRAPDALVRLGELEMLRGRPAVARQWFERVLHEFPSGPQRLKSHVWIARSFFDERDNGKACAVVSDLRAAELPDGEMRLQVEDLTRRCAAVSAAANAPTAGAPASGTTTTATRDSAPAASGGAARATGKYSVQLAAYQTKAEATASVKRLKKRGIEARVDGERKPFRVRVGRYATHAEAAAALAKFKKQGIKGFIAELTP
jgi:cell division septation protein DedD